DAFALPYWNWSAANARSLPKAFLDPGSPLYEENRKLGVNNGSKISSVTVRGLEQSMEFRDFALDGERHCFGGSIQAEPTHLHKPHGELETRPHDGVHGFVGGLMNSAETAAQDPIFWLHHANVDRLWTVWLSMGGGRKNPSKRDWLTRTFTFYDENGNKVQ